MKTSRLVVLTVLACGVAFSQGNQNQVQTGAIDGHGAQWRFPESTYAGLPSASTRTGYRFTVTDCSSAACTAGGGTIVADLRSNGTAWALISGGGGSGSITTYASSLFVGPDTTRTILYTTHNILYPPVSITVWDNSNPRQTILTGAYMDPNTFDVTIPFGTGQSNYYVDISGTPGSPVTVLSLASLTNGQLASLTNSQLSALTN